MTVIKFKSLERTFTDHVSWSMLMHAFLERRVRVFRTLCTVSVSFNSKLEAEEFYKLLLSKRGRS
jgi:hypothetical protein